MFFNNDLLIVVGSIIVGSLFTYTFYNNIFSTNSESLVNTLPSLDSISELPVATINHVNVGVQTESKTLWSLFKDWLRDVFSVNSSDVGSFGQTKVNNWINNLDSTQSIISQNVNSVVADSHLDTLIDVQDSASNISAISSYSTVVPVIPYDINEVETYNILLVLPNANFSQVLIN